MNAQHRVLTDSITPTAYPPVLLERKARAIKESMALDPEKGQICEVRTVFDGPDRECARLRGYLHSSLTCLPSRWKNIVKKALVRPFMLFICEPIIQLLGAYMALVYGTLYSKYGPALSTFSVD